jgi:hypothetical protein
MPNLAGSALGMAHGLPTRKIATEDAFARSELVKAWLEVARTSPRSSLDIPIGILSIFDNPPPGSNQDGFRRRPLDLDNERIADMDDAGVDVQILSVTIPGGSSTFCFGSP